VRDGVQQGAEVVAGLDVTGYKAADEQPAPGHTTQRGPGAGHPQPGSLAQAEHGHVILFEKLGETPVAPLPLRAADWVVRVDLERDQAQGGQRRGLHNRHVVGGADGRAGKVRPGADAEIRHPIPNAAADGG